MRSGLSSTPRGRTQPVFESASHRRCPLSWHGIGFTLSRPRRHRYADGRKRLRTERPDLKVGSEGKRDAHARIDRNHLLLVLQLPPHLPPPIHEVPYLLNRPMGHGNGRLAGRELEVGKAAAAQWKKHTDVRSVRSDRIGPQGKPSGAQAAHQSPPPGSASVTAPLL